MVSKKFSKSFDDALTQAYLFHTNFNLNKDEFTNFSSIFQDPFSENFEEMIATADNFPTFEDDQNDQAIYTLQVEETMAKARNHFKKLSFSIDITWPNSEINQRAFRMNQFESARQMPQKMINLLQNAYSKANSSTYRDGLLEGGFDEDDIDLLEGLENELTERYNLQQDFIQQTFERTEQRTIAFNRVWDEMVKISNASKLIFKNSPAKIETFLLYPELSTGTGGGSGGSSQISAPTNFRYDFAERTVKWNSVSGATSYKLEKSDDNTIWDVMYEGENTEYFTGEMLPEHKYLRVRSRNSQGMSVPALYNVVYNYILNGPTNLTHNPALPGFTWDAVTNATAYEVQLRLASATDFDYNLIYFGNDTTLLHGDPVGSYYVRVRSVSATGFSGWILLAYSVGV